MIASGAIQPLDWQEGQLRLLDQTALPADERWITLTSVEGVAAAIARMQVRGAPAIGIVAVAGMALAAKAAAAAGADLSVQLAAAADLLLQTRPTAVNLRWAVERALREAAIETDAAQVAKRLRELDSRVLSEQWAADRALSALGAELFPGPARILTHCNTGALATGGYGTALGIIRTLHEFGRLAMVYVDESRPRLQGAQLTVWELHRLGAPYTLVPDVAAAAIMAQGEVDAVNVGADRIAANGDTANKIGTYQLAIAAHYHKIPCYVAAPISTLDPATATGRDIPIEEREADEVRRIGGALVTLADAPVRNWAFDVTPAELITAIITERGVLEPPYDKAIAAVLDRSSHRSPGSHGCDHDVD